MFLYSEQEVQTKSNPESLKASKEVTDHKKDSMVSSSENSDSGGGNSEEEYEEVLMTK